jgi:hypothetical protein
MSSATNSMVQMKGNAGTMPMNAVVQRSEELRPRKEDLDEIPFVETIVGRRGSLRGILPLVESVAPTNMTVLIAGETIDMTETMRQLMLVLLRGKKDEDYVFTREAGSRVVAPRKEWYSLCVSSGLGKYELVERKNGESYKVRATRGTSGSTRMTSGVRHFGT